MSHKGNIHVLGVGLHPNHPAHSTHPSRHGGRYEPSQLAENFKVMYADIEKSPYNADSLLFEPDKSNDLLLNEFVSLIKAKNYAAIMFGWNFRGHPEFNELFEEMINAARLHAPNSALCFNTKATDTVQAVDRVLAKAKG